MLYTMNEGESKVKEVMRFTTRLVQQDEREDEVQQPNEVRVLYDQTSFVTTYLATSIITLAKSILSLFLKTSSL